MAPDDRRRAIIEAVTPLLVAQGAAVTTRQMAEAAGVAEGTIYRVFPDKCALINEVVKASVDPEPFHQALGVVDPESPIEDQIRTAAAALQIRVERMMALTGVLRSLHTGDHDHHDHHAHHEPPEFVVAAHRSVMDAITHLFERHRDQLRVEPARAAVMLRGLVFAAAFPILPEPQRPTMDEAIDLMLNGLITGNPIATDSP